MQVFELERRTVADAAVQAAYVVPALEKREETPPCLFVGREVFATEQFGFECAEERLAHRVVISIAGRAHRRLYACFTAAPSKGNGRVLTALVGMQNHTFMASLLQRHVQCA